MEGEKIEKDAYCIKHICLTYLVVTNIEIPLSIIQIYWRNILRYTYIF